jgi:thiol-disulfide isomerase/thioredoxin
MKVTRPHVLLPRTPVPRRYTVYSTIKHEDGKVVSPLMESAPMSSADESHLSSLLGKPVLLDFWATWCGPCVAAIPDLKKLYAETRDKGLVWIGIDEDQDPARMNAFIKENNIPWPSANDADGSVGKAFGPHGIPLEVLIDASGKVTYYAMGYDDANLRTAIAKLGTEFSSVETKSEGASTARQKP